MKQLLNLIATPVYAQNPIGIIQPPASVISNVGQVGNFISIIVSAIIAFSGLFAVLQFILGGLGYITAGGDSKKVQDALHKITYSIIGLVIIAASFIIAGILGFLLYRDATIFLQPKFQTL